VSKFEEETQQATKDRKSAATDANAMLKTKPYGITAENVTNDPSRDREGAQKKSSISLMALAWGGKGTTHKIGAAASFCVTEETPIHFEVNERQDTKENST